MIVNVNWQANVSSSAMKNTLMFSTTGLWEIHNSQMIDLCYSELNLGNSVFLYSCDFSIFSCRTNPEHLVSRCKMCVRQSKRNENKLLPTGVVKIRVPSSNVLPVSKDSFRLDTHKQMLEFTYGGFEFGRSVISQLQTVLKESEIDDFHIKNEGNEILGNAIALYHFFLSELKARDIKKVFVFGGRYAAERALIFASKHAAVSFETFETGSAIDKIWLSKEGETSFDSYILDIQKSQSKFDEVQRQEVKRVGKDFFIDWRNGSSQDPKYLNPNLRLREGKSGFNALRHEVGKGSEKKHLTMFTSTNYEFLAFDDFKILDSDDYSQFDVIQMLNDCDELLSVYFITVRWHPNSQNSGANDQKAIQECINSTPRLNHILSSADDNSYTLIESSDVIVSFGSTIGVEGAAMGKPSIVLAKCSYSNLDATYEPRDFQEFLRILFSPALESKSEQAFMWGYWRSTFGQRLKFVKYEEANKFFISGFRVVSLYSRFIDKYNIFRHIAKSSWLKLSKSFRFKKCEGIR